MIFIQNAIEPSMCVVNYCISVSEVVRLDYAVVVYIYSVYHFLHSPRSCLSSSLKHKYQTHIRTITAFSTFISFDALMLRRDGGLVALGLTLAMYLYLCTHSLWHAR